MDKTEIIDRVCGVLQKIFKGQNITSDSGQYSVDGWDSLNHMQIIVATEAEFNIELPVLGVSDLMNVSSVVYEVQEALKRA